MILNNIKHPHRRLYVSPQIWVEEMEEEELMEGSGWANTEEIHNELCEHGEKQGECSEPDCPYYFDPFAPSKKSFFDDEY